MEKKEIIIKITNERIYLNPQLHIPIENTNIPITHLKFRSRGELYWKVEMLEYSEIYKSLLVRVMEYTSTDFSKFNQQSPKKEVQILLFEKFDWLKLEPILSSYQRIKLKEVLDNIESDPYFPLGDNSQWAQKRIDWERNNELLEADENKLKHLVTDIKVKNHKPVVSNIYDTFKVKFTDAKFMLGYVACKNFIKRLGIDVHFKIPNEHILEEFENIKFWFSKKLKTKTFTVIANITIVDNIVTEVFATSKQIAQITPEIIDGVKYQRTLALSKPPRINLPDKSLFTGEEIFDQIDSEDLEGNIFNQTELDILNFFIQNESIRNRKQLAYLAGKKQSEEYKLRYTLNPHFGFLFFIKGKENNHFVWELLDSHATYIWSMQKSGSTIEFQIKRIENILNIIRASGRENYKKEYRNNRLDEDIVFNLIDHKKIDSNSVDSFPKWKDRLNDQLI